MLTRLDVRDARAGLGEALETTGRGREDPAVVPAVRAILDQVRTEGDAALRALTERFDGAAVQELRVPRSECEAATRSVAPEILESLETAADRIEAYHRAQAEVPPVGFDADGISVAEVIHPVDRAGLYAPGGRACYPSTVLMTSVPARVAGVEHRVLCVPPDATGKVPAVTLAAALLTGVEEIYRVGGAQAIGAMAYGTESIDRVDVIVGPGNAYVDAAKRLVAAEGRVGIDGPAGPSELVVIADAGAEPLQVAVDLMAQAEHGPGGCAYLVAWDAGLLDEVLAAVARSLSDAPRAAEIRSTLISGGYAVLVRDARQAVEVANAIAPEHLELLTADAEALLPAVRHAGAVFVNTPTAIGDYVAGANHVLPTGGTARFASALRVDDFQTHMHVVRADAEGLRGVGVAAEVLARAEGLSAHAASIELRRRQP